MIPPQYLLPQDLVIVWDKGPLAKPFGVPVKMKMHATDASHALDVEPTRYTLDEPKPEPKFHSGKHR